MQTTRQPEVMDSHEVCALLGMSLRTLTRRVKEGKMVPLPKPPGLERHHKLYFRREDVEKFLH